MSDNQKDKKSTLINELDSLKHTLNSGPEYQQDIPILDEPYRDTTHHETNDFFDDHDLDVPILTDPFETAPTETVSPKELSLEIDDITPYEVSEVSIGEEVPKSTKVENTETDNAVQLNSIDLQKLSEETDCSLIELDQVLDELVAEQLPKLEQQLREKLRHELESSPETPLESQLRQKIVASKG